MTKLTTSDEAFEAALVAEDVAALSGCIEARLAQPAVPGATLLLRAEQGWPPVVRLNRTSAGHWVTLSGRRIGSLTIARRLIAQRKLPLPATLDAVRNYDCAVADGAEDRKLAVLSARVGEAFVKDTKHVNSADVAKHVTPGKRKPAGGDTDLSFVRRLLRDFAPLYR